MQPNRVKKDNIIGLLTLTGIVLLAVIISEFLFTRFDLTTDKRFTLSKHTKTMLRETDDIIYFKIYLSGSDLPSGFMRLQNSVREILDEFRAYGKDNIQYEFIDPSASSDIKTRNKVFKQLYEKGLEPTNLQVKEKDGATSQKIIFPGILVSYQGNELPVNILKNYVGYSPEGNLNSSVQSLEYELTFAIQKLMTKTPPRIGFIDGHGELEPILVDNLAQTLNEYYKLERVTLNENQHSLRDASGNNLYHLIIIAKPEKPFPEKDKFIIDQYLMNGGNILWLIDPVKTSIDSLARNRSTIAIANLLNLDDQLFKYGIRLNLNLIQDMQCATIPVNTSMVGQPPKFAPAPWVYFGLLTPDDNNPITKNLDLIRSQFASSIDTVGDSRDIKKTVLLTTSKYSRTVNAPTVIDLSIVNDRMDPSRFTKSFLPVGVLLEGSFKSAFTNRVSPIASQNPDNGFIKQGKPAKMMVFSDGDIIQNGTQQNEGRTEPLPLGYDRYTRQTFGNKELMLNCINYLCNMQGLMESRSKEVRLRMLDKPAITQHRIEWELINILIPITLIIAFGILYHFLRKNKYSK